MRKRIIAVGMLAAVALLLSGCSSPVLVKGTSVAVAVSDAFTSANPATTFGNQPTNAEVAAATSSQFASYDSTPALVHDTSFGSATVVSTSPFQVKYTIAPGVEWSDGTPVDAADLMLSWVANSGVRNTKGFDVDKYTDDSGRFTSALPAGVVHFDGFTGGGLQLVTAIPVVGDGGRSLTLSYNKYFADWQLVFGVGLPAHVVAKHAFGSKTVQSAENSLLKAVRSNDTAALAKLARVWNTAYDFTSTPKSTDLLVSDGPYTVSSITQDAITLAANPHYSGDHRPRFARVVLRVISDPLAQVQALKAGTVDVISPTPAADVDSAIAAIHGVTTTSGFDGAWEHLDLQFSHSRNGTFDDPRVRAAFLDVVPRQKILDTVVKPLEKKAALRSSQVFLPGSAGYDQAVAKNGSKAIAKTDVAAAKALLAQAGVSAPPVCILFDPSNPRRVEEFALIQSSAALAGFVVTDCSSPGWSQLLGTPGAYDAALFAFRPTSLAVSAVGATYASDSLIDNDNFYSSPQVDALIARLDASDDPATQQQLMSEIDSRLFADSYGAPLYQFPAITAVDGRVSGVSRSPLPPSLLWNIWAWTPVVQGK